MAEGSENVIVIGTWYCCRSYKKHKHVCQDWA